MANVAGTDSASAGEKRWKTIGICLNNILAPNLRKAIDEEFQDWYNRLTKPPTEIHKQVFGKELKTLEPSTFSLQYKNINNNAHSSPSEYDYAVKDPLSLAKLFVLPFMEKFTGFDETMDLLAALNIMVQASPFVDCGASVYADNVREYRNEWKQSEYPRWTKDKFNNAIEEMQSLVKNTNLPDAVKKKVCGELQRCENKGSHESPKWQEVSITHRKKFEMLMEHLRKFPQEILEIIGVFVCIKEKFLVGEGGQSEGVFVALGRDGSEKAVKLFLKATHGHLAEKEKKLLTTCDTKELAHVVKYWYLDDKSSSTFAFLIMELCEETLDKFVGDNSLGELVKCAPAIIQQIVKGLAGLHRKPKRILHRDLKPSNILRNVHGKWLLADFGIGRILSDDKSTLQTMQRGSKKWSAVESCDETGTSDDSQVRYKTKSDIQVAGMVAFYILTKGKHPFGEDEQVRSNLLAANPVNLKMLDGHPFAKDLISWMLSKDPKDRPSAEEALQHPYLKSKEQQFKLLWGMGNYVKRKDANSDVLEKLNENETDWKTRVDSDVLEYLSYDKEKKRKYEYTSWADCLRLIRNIKEHWEDYERTEPEAIKVGDPQEYFLGLFPDLVLGVYKIARSCDDLKELLGLKEYFEGQ